MMRKLRDLQAQVDERSSDVIRKESQMNMLEAEKDAAVKRLRDAEGTVTSSLIFKLPKPRKVFTPDRSYFCDVVPFRPSS